MSCLTLPPRSLAKSYLDLDGFTRAVELLAEKVYKSRPANLDQLAEHIHLLEAEEAMEVAVRTHSADFCGLLRTSEEAMEAAVRRQQQQTMDASAARRLEGDDAQANAHFGKYLSSNPPDAAAIRRKMNGE